MKLSQRMIKVFCASMSSSEVRLWTALSDRSDDIRRVTTRKNTEPDQPNGVILTATSTTWLPFSHQKVFELLTDEHKRSQGFITKDRKNIDPAVALFARGSGPDETEGLREGASLLEVVKRVKPHVLLGLSGVGGIFNEEVLKAMRESGSSRPAIFAMLNPTTNAECTAKDAFKHAGESIIFASGSPFDNVRLGKGHQWRVYMELVPS